MAKQNARHRVNFGTYQLDELETVEWFARDIIRTVEMLLRVAGGQEPGMEPDDLSALGNLLEWARECQEYHGIDGDKGKRERLAARLADSIPASRRRKAA